MTAHLPRVLRCIRPALLARPWMAVAAIGLAAVLGSGCSSVPSEQVLPALPLAYTLQGGKHAENCFRLAAGERIDYEFTASVPVDFDVHYHRAGAVVNPVKVPRTREQAGTFASPHEEDYCMMWVNPGAVPAHVSGRWRRLR